MEFSWGEWNGGRIDLDSTIWINGEGEELDEIGMLCCLTKFGWIVVTTTTGRLDSGVGVWLCTNARCFPWAWLLALNLAWFFLNAAPIVEAGSIGVGPVIWEIGGNLMDGSFVFFNNASSRDCCADLFLLSTCWTISSGGCCLFFCWSVWGIGRPASPSGTLGKSNFVTGIQPGSGTIFFEAPLGLACCKICCNGVGFRLIVLCLLGPTFTFCCS